MSSWLFFTITSAGIYAGVNFIDKYIIKRQIKDYRGMPIFSALMGLLFGLVFWIVNGFPILPFVDAVLITLSGAFTIWAIYFYFRALTSSATSTLIILFQMIPVFVLLFSYLFFKETINLEQTLGFTLILLASIGVSIEWKKKRLKLSSAFIDALIANIFWTIGIILFKFVIETTSFAEVVSYESWGISIGGLFLYILFPTIRKAFNDSFKKLSKVALLAVFINESLYIVAKLLQYFAFSIGPTALVSVAGGTQIFFGVLYGYVLTLLWPKTFKEDIRQKEMVKKIIFACLTFIGIILIS